MGFSETMPSPTTSSKLGFSLERDAFKDMGIRSPTPASWSSIDTSTRWKRRRKRSEWVNSTIFPTRRRKRRKKKNSRRRRMNWRDMARRIVTRRTLDQRASVNRTMRRMKTTTSLGTSPNAKSPKWWTPMTRKRRIVKNRTRKTKRRRERKKNVVENLGQDHDPDLVPEAEVVPAVDLGPDLQDPRRRVTRLRKDRVRAPRLRRRKVLLKDLLKAPTKKTPVRRGLAPTPPLTANLDRPVRRLRKRRKK